MPRSLCPLYYSISGAQAPMLPTLFYSRYPGPYAPYTIVFFVGAQAPMPPELHELYMLYQQELQTRQSEKETNFLSELNVMLRVGKQVDR